MKKKLFLIFIFPVIVFCQQNNVKIYSLEECINLALQNNNMLKSSKARMTNYEAKYDESKSMSLPSLKFLGSYSRLSEIDPFEIQFPVPISKTVTVSPVLLNSTNLKLNLQQPIFTGSKISGSIDIANLNFQSQLEDYQKDKIDLITNVKIAYFYILKAVSITQNVNENITKIESHLRDLNNFFSRGQITKNDILKVEVQYYNLKSVLVDAENMVVIAKLNLSNLMGASMETEFDILKTEFSEDKVNSLEFYQKSALEKRNDLKSFEKKIKIAGSGITVANSNWFPQIYLNANYTYANPNPRIMPSKDKFIDTWDVGISMSFDIWNWGSSAKKVEQAEAQYDEVKSGYNSFKDQVLLEVNQIYLNIKRINESINYQKKAIEQAEENYKIAKDKFEKGYLSSSELLDAETFLFEAKNNCTNLVIDYNISIAKLDRASANFK